MGRSDKACAMKKKISGWFRCVVEPIRFPDEVRFYTFHLTQRPVNAEEDLTSKWTQKHGRRFAIACL